MIDFEEPEIKDRQVVIMDRASHDPIEGVLGIAYAIVFITLVAGFYFLATRAFHIFSTLKEHVPDKWLLGQIGAVGTLIVGAILFFFREKRRLWYALAELAFAVVTGGFAINSVKDRGDLGVWVALGGASYLVVRGLDNLSHAGVNVLGTLNRVEVMRASGEGNPPEDVGVQERVHR